MNRLINESDVIKKLHKERKTFGVLGVDIVNWIDGYVKECPTIHAIPLDKVKAAKNEIIDSKILKVGYEYYYSSEDVIKILNKLIAESEKV